MLRNRLLLLLLKHIGHRTYSSSHPSMVISVASLASDLKNTQKNTLCFLTENRKLIRRRKLFFISKLLPKSKDKHNIKMIQNEHVLGGEAMLFVFLNISQKYED